MNRFLMGATTLALALSTGASLAASRPALQRPAVSAGIAISGDYMESRSLSVYAGACHYGGEAVTAGKEAVLAWRVKEGAWNGQTLNGLSVVAVVNGPENLAMSPGGHHSLIYVDQSATPEQREALVNLVSSRYGDVVGTVAEVNSAPIQFEMKEKTYRLNVPGAVYLAADKFPCAKCVMPHQVWYQPFVSLKGAEVARALRTDVKTTAPDFTSWSKDETNSAYVGEFTL